MITASIKISADGLYLQVSGELTFVTVAALRDSGNQLLNEIKEPIFDFSGVTRSDSAALALLTAWSRYARKLGKAVKFINIPTQLLDIARLSNLDRVLSLSPAS